VPGLFGFGVVVGACAQTNRVEDVDLDKIRIGAFGDVSHNLGNDPVVYIVVLHGLSYFS